MDANAILLDPFKGDGYSTVTLTAAINRLPNNYGRIDEMNLFPRKGVYTEVIAVEQRQGVLNILPTRPRGSAGTQGTQAKRQLRYFTIPQIPHDDTVKPADVSGVRSFGTADVSGAVAQMVNDKLATMRMKHAITHEYLRFGALKGVVLDADLSVIYDFFAEFGITQKVIPFKLATSTDVRGSCVAVSRWIEQHLFGETMTGVHCFCSPEFFDALTTNTSVKTAFQYFQQGQNLSGDFRKAFQFGGITFEEYLGQVMLPPTVGEKQAQTIRFIGAGDAYCFPLGTQETFIMRDAPADFNETVNTLGQPVYAKIHPEEFDRGWKLHTQSNPLPMCVRPEVIVKIQA